MLIDLPRRVVTYWTNNYPLAIYLGIFMTFLVLSLKLVGVSYNRTTLSTNISACITLNHPILNHFEPNTWLGMHCLSACHIVAMYHLWQEAKYMQHRGFWGGNPSKYYYGLKVLKFRVLIGSSSSFSMLATHMILMVGVLIFFGCASCVHGLLRMGFHVCCLCTRLWWE